MGPDESRQNLKPLNQERTQTMNEANKTKQGTKMKILNITFDYENDGIAVVKEGEREIIPPACSYSPDDKIVYTWDGWRIWATTEEAAKTIVEKEITRTWCEDYASAYYQMKNKGNLPGTIGAGPQSKALRAQF